VQRLALFANKKLEDIFFTKHDNKKKLDVLRIPMYSKVFRDNLLLKLVTCTSCTLFRSRPDPFVQNHFEVGFEKVNLNLKL
jgi:hypothetical protein